MCRHVTWFRQARRPDLVVGGQRTMQFADLGIEQVSGHPAYDNGAYYVVDTVEGLEWAVMSSEGRLMKKFQLEKYSAIEWADMLKESDGRTSYEDARLHRHA